ncbi:c-type cytochrome domain-containing protein [Sphingobacterium lumbrici]|uniref:c-type cytochrome domain-containing protein n=1 Tax=Sphingobacterium lumbrici TaxID=2559600 RepID=UPI00112EC6B1|nr:c-type cytochrome domain-containing protein [Sphingobacterium lumbrici]
MMFFEELSTFIGRWHPLLVHLPIGMLVLAFAMALATRFDKSRDYQAAICFTLLLGAIAAVFAGITGYLLSRNGGYEADVLNFHQWLGIAVGIVSFLTFFLYRDTTSVRTWLVKIRKQRFWFLFVIVVLLGFTGHYGGTLTHGKGYIKDALPTGIKNALRIANPEEETLTLENAQEAIVYEGIIQPILTQRCQSCHGDKKQEGGLRLHTRENLLKGGENGVVLRNGDATKSELYARLILPEGHKGRMPPKGRTPITPDQIKLIAWWIETGADFNKKAKELKQSDEILAILQKLESGAEVQESSLFAGLPEAPPLPEEKIRNWQAKGIKVMPVATDNNFVMINAINYPQFNDDDLKDLLQIKDNIVQLKIGSTAVTDAGMKFVMELPVLIRLHVEHTVISDAGLAQLKGLKNLEYINLVGSKVTADGLASLAAIPTLKHVYAFQTQMVVSTKLGKGNEDMKLDTGSYRLPFLDSDTVRY